MGEGSSCLWNSGLSHTSETCSPYQSVLNSVPPLLQSSHLPMYALRSTLLPPQSVLGSSRFVSYKAAGLKTVGVKKNHKTQIILKLLKAFMRHNKCSSIYTTLLKISACVIYTVTNLYIFYYKCNV